MKMKTRCERTSEKDQKDCKEESLYYEHLHKRKKRSLISNPLMYLKPLEKEKTNQIQN
jgi:hypothetical protein